MARAVEVIDPLVDPACLAGIELPAGTPAREVHPGPAPAASPARGRQRKGGLGDGPKPPPVPVAFPAAADVRTPWSPPPQAPPVRRREPWESICWQANLPPSRPAPYSPEAIAFVAAKGGPTVLAELEASVRYLADRMKAQERELPRVAAAEWTSAKKELDATESWYRWCYDALSDVARALGSTSGLPEREHRSPLRRHLELGTTDPRTVIDRKLAVALRRPGRGLGRGRSPRQAARGAPTAVLRRDDRAGRAGIRVQADLRSIRRGPLFPHWPGADPPRPQGDRGAGPLRHEELVGCRSALMAAAFPHGAVRGGRGVEGRDRIARGRQDRRHPTPGRRRGPCHRVGRRA